MTRNFRPDRQSPLMVLALVITLGACGQRRVDEPFRSATMPDPAGCYVLVFDQPKFAGAREFINGPITHASLEDLPFRANWRRRIRSLQVGSSASVTMWDNEGTQGASQTLSSNSQLSAIREPLSGRVQSLEIRCTP